jgi:hypothetical protein
LLRNNWKEQMTYIYTMPKCGHPRTWRSDKKLNAVRDYWFCLSLWDGSIIIKRKSFNWAGACCFGDALFAATEGADVLFCVDGRVPEAELAFPPIAAVWNRWEHSSFIEDGH